MLPNIMLSQTLKKKLSGDHIQKPHITTQDKARQQSVYLHVWLCASKQKESGNSQVTEEILGLVDCDKKWPMAGLGDFYMK